MTTFLRGIVPGVNDSVENSYCRLNSANSTASNSGTAQTLTLDLYFKPAFAGAKTIAAIIETKANQFSNTAALGSWTVPQ
jgi:hypothetical protein